MEARPAQEVARNDLGGLEIHDGSARVANDVGRDERIIGHAEHAGVARRCGLLSKNPVDLLDTRGPRSEEREVCNRADS